MMKIVSFGQQIMLDSELSVVNTIIVELEDGTQVPVPTVEETIQALMKLHMGVPMEREVPAVAAPGYHTEPVESENYPDEEDDEDGDPGELYSVPEDAVMGTLGSVPASVNQFPAAIGSPQPKPQPRVDQDGFMITPKSRTVPKDEMGYPIVQPRAVPQQRQLVGDEDGEQI